MKRCLSQLWVIFLSKNVSHFGLLLASLVLIILASWAVYKSFLPTSSLELALYSVVVLAATAIQIVERYFTKPADAIINSAGVLLIVLPLKEQPFGQTLAYGFAVLYSMMLLTTSIMASVLFDPTKNGTSSQKISAVLKEFSTKFGSAKLLYSVCFLVLILHAEEMFGLNSFHVVAAAVLLLNLALDRHPLPRFWEAWTDKKAVTGEMIGTTGYDVLIGSYPINQKIRDFVCYKRNDVIRVGRVITKHASLDETRVEFVATNIEPPEEIVVSEGQFVSIDDDKFEAALVGYVEEGTTVSELKFVPFADANIGMGSILEVSHKGRLIYYQVQDGRIDFRPVDSNNRDNRVIATAAQLGTFNQHTQIFERFDWLPRATSLVSLPSDFPQPEIRRGEYCLGTFPTTSFPVYIDVKEMIRHHCAILGVTGTGKSVFARELIRETASEDNKYICVDITNEYSGKFGNSIVSLIPTDKQKQLGAIIEVLYKERQKFPGTRRPENRDDAMVQKKLKEAFEIMKPLIQNFMESDKHIGLVEFVDLSGTIQNYEFLKTFFQALFELAKEQKFSDRTVCIVIEEAHTIVPEWNFVADNDKAISSLLNSISQIALQGRKYGVGLMVIAQRTANVSKTILTQCNTVIAFQQFDKTSADFLESFVGGDAGKILPTLKPRTAIATGKGLRSSTPVIFEVPSIDESAVPVVGGAGEEGAS